MKKTNAVNLNTRQEAILLSLKRLGFLTRDQLSSIHSLGRTRNTNRILSSISHFVHTFREGYATVYYLNSQGREYTDAKRRLRKCQFVTHALMRNDWFIYSGCPAYWKNEIKISDSVSSRVCDTLYKEGEYFKVLEVDHLQSMKENKIKALEYAQMYKRGLAAKQLGYFPVVVWLTVSEHRRERLKRICSEVGLPSEVYTLNDIK